jgi:type II secretory pathway pseudopilin PulG
MVELAVIIAMTGILTALLLPALSSAKEKSRRAICKSNLHQLYLVSSMYANESADFLPSPGDNAGNYHSIRLSDQTFTKLAVQYADGVSNIFYCPNILESSVAQHDAYGYVIGYSYLAAITVPATKGAGYTVVPTTMVAAPTNKLWADANYWSLSANTAATPWKMAPHTASGASTAQAAAAIPNALAPTNSASLGAMGGNVELYDGSVTWRTIGGMQTYSASSVGDAFGNW